MSEAPEAAAPVGLLKGCLLPLLALAVLAAVIAGLCWFFLLAFHWAASPIGPKPSPPAISAAAPKATADPRLNAFNDLMGDYRDLDLKRPAPIWGDCDNTDDQASCISAAINMAVQWWPGAWRGRVEDQRNVAECLYNNCSGSVQISGTDACAWRYVIAASGGESLTDRDAVGLRQACEDLSEEEHLIARSKALGIVQAIPSKGADVPKTFVKKAVAL